MCHMKQKNFQNRKLKLSRNFFLENISGQIRNIKSSLLPRIRSLVQLSRNISRYKNSKSKRHVSTKKASTTQGLLTYSRLRTNKYKASSGMAINMQDDPLTDCNESISTGPREIVVQPTTKNPAFMTDGNLEYKERVSSFETLGLCHDVLKALDSMNVRQPTVIQMVAIPKILQRHHVLLAAQTGSGKTISYLAPLVHLLREEEERHGIVARLNRPRACIVVPARELAVQVLKVAKFFSHYARFRSTGVIGGRKQKFIREDLKSPVDLIVATPGTLLKYRQKDRLFFSDLTHLVIDEADTMFDSSFKKLTMELLHTIHVRHSKPPLPHGLPIDAQVTVVGATLPEDFLVSTLAEVVPNMKKCTSGLHRVLPHVKHVFMKMNNSNKADYLIQLLRKDVRQGVRTVVFCNSAKACDWLGHCLASHDFSFIRLHGNIPPEIRCQRFEDFQKRVADILICTDIASRGLDTSDVGHVINFDFPVSVIDYIHRIGRTGRVGNKLDSDACRATSFVTHNRDARLARALQIAASRNVSVEVAQSRR